MGLARFIAQLFDRLLKSPSNLTKATPSGPEALTSMELGELGELLAGRYVAIRHGYRLLYRNFVAPKGGEVDLVCRDGDILAFIEVKSRKGFESGSPARAVDRAKEGLITKGAMHWLRLLGHPGVDFRFDVVEVLLEEGEVPRINLIKGAFELPEPIRY